MTGIESEPSTGDALRRSNTGYRSCNGDSKEDRFVDTSSFNVTLKK